MIVEENKRCSLNNEVISQKRLKRCQSEIFYVHSKSRDKRWQQRFNELVSFRIEKGHCNVAQRYPPNRSLGKWVHKQRDEFKRHLLQRKSALDPFRITALLQIGFQVSVDNLAEALWHDRFDQLLVFVKNSGHCRVPQQYSENRALGKWVHRQKHEGKKRLRGEKSLMNTYRFEALKQLNFF